MNNFIISQEHAQYVLNILGEFPAKNVLQAIEILRNLKPVSYNEEKQKEE